MAREADCCSGTDIETPALVENRPGLRAIAYRVGTHTQFKRTMLARLSAAAYPRLAGLRTREDDDFSIAFLDAWATVADVLTFYQERIANESYLRTATEQRSLLGLAGLVGYSARGGVAASTLLAFTLETAAGAPAETTIASGVRVQSIPGPGEQPQFFETTETISARPAWNAIGVRATVPQQLALDMEQVVVRGTATNIRPGDSVLIVVGTGTADRAVMRVLAVRPDNQAQITRLDLTDDPPDQRRRFRVRTAVQPISLAEQSFLAEESLITRQLTTNSFASNISQTLLASNLQFSSNQFSTNSTPFIAGVPAAQSDISAIRVTEPVPNRPLPDAEPGVYVFRQRAAIFGHNALIPDDASDPAARTLATEAGGRRAVYLDNRYPTIVRGGWLVLESEFAQNIYRIEDTGELSRADFGISAKVTRLRVDTDNGLDDLTIRETTVFAQSEQLDLADIPVLTPLDGSVIQLNGVYPGLTPGRHAILSGVDAQTGAALSEPIVISLAETIAGRTVLTLAAPLAGSYRRTSIVINANVAAATHGETVSEVLGSGDASQPFQRFTLRQPPLTRVSAATGVGSRSTLEVRVDGLLWQEVASFYGRGPHERIYVTATDDQGRTTVTFGDGINGARLPTGQENVRAVYRKGLGADGNLDAGQLSLLLTRPLGVRSTTNPLPSSGGAAGETAAELRDNLPLTTLTLDRIVSLQDYEDFARAFAGVAKAQASWSWDGRTRSVFVTVAGADGAAIQPGSQLHDNLLAAMQAAGDPFVPLRIATYRPAVFTLAAGIKVDQPTYLPETVLAAVEAALRSTFGFSQRSFGQSVALSEVIATMQAVPGVIAVDVDSFVRSASIVTRLTTAFSSASRLSLASAFTLPDRLLAASATTDNGEPQAAELLTITSGALKLKVLQ